MIARCTYPSQNSYKYYGGRGIEVSEAWRGPGGFDRFLADMGERPAGKTLDRMDPDGHYEPANCRWATPKEQAANKRQGARSANAEKTHCPRGHAYSEENTYVTKKGYRQCKACRRVREAQKRQEWLADPYAASERANEVAEVLERIYVEAELWKLGCSTFTSPEQVVDHLRKRAKWSLEEVDAAFAKAPRPSLQVVEGGRE